MLLNRTLPLRTQPARPAPQLLAKKIKQLEKKIGEHERAAGGSLEELQDRLAASQERMNRDGKRYKEAIQMYKVRGLAQAWECWSVALHVS